MSQTVDFRATPNFGESASYFQPIEETVDVLAEWGEADCARLEDELPESAEHLLTGLSLVMNVLRTAQVNLLSVEQESDRAQRELLDELHALGVHHAPQRELHATALKLAQVKAVTKISVQAHHKMLADASNFFDKLTSRYHRIFIRTTRDDLGFC